MGWRHAESCGDGAELCGDRVEMFGDGVEMCADGVEMCGLVWRCVDTWNCVEMGCRHVDSYGDVCRRDGDV